MGDYLHKNPIPNEENARLIMAQLFLVLDFMARKSVVHKDLKPDNILLNSRSPGNFDIRIADFGFATVVNGSQQIIKIDT